MGLDAEGVWLERGCDLILKDQGRGLELEGQAGV